MLDALMWQGQQSPETYAKIEAVVRAAQPAYPAVARALSRHLPRIMTQTPLQSIPSELVSLAQPRVRVTDVALPDSVRAQLHGLIAEFGAVDALAAEGLSPRNRVLLSGPPGNGKTMLAEALALELQLPFLCVRYGGLVASHLGETSRNIDRLIAYAGQAPCVLFWDEFDGVAVRRSHGSDVTEMRRVTNQLLMVMDRLSSHTVLIAATNEEGLIDRAITRRFDVRVEVPAPTADVMLDCARAALGQSAALFARSGVDIAALAASVASEGHENLASLVDRCRQIRRELVLSGAK
jgi:SpoVK/Ycf46/Vps4 family AAA+-type ATPase